MPSTRQVQDQDDDAEQRVTVEFAAKERKRSRVWLATAALTGAGIAGRAALQWMPSVEPVLPLAIAAGVFMNWRHGAVAGAAGFYLSNFLVWGGQGPWTVFQVAGAAAAGALAGGIGTVSRRPTAYAAALVAGTLVYELAVNLGSLGLTPWLVAAGPAMLVAAAPFIGAHLLSTLGFGGILYGFRDHIDRLYDNRLAVRRARGRSAAVAAAPGRTRR